MAVIETKYSVGDVVYHAGTATERKQHPCPDCRGERKWKAVSPAGTEYTFGCPRCSTRFMSNSDLSLAYTANVPAVRRLTIGSVQYNSAPGSWDNGARYMCVETGVGGGTVYDEGKLFDTEEAALAAASASAALANTETEWVAKLYDQSLEISDYELDSASLKLAADAKTRAGSMLWNINDLFASIEEAGDLDAVKEAVGEYRDYHMKGDLAELTEASA